MDVFAQAMADLAASDLGTPAQYFIKGVGPGLDLRLILDTEDDEVAGRITTRTVANVPADAEQIGRPEAGDTILVGEKLWRVAQVAQNQRGWAWSLTLATVR